MKGITEPVMYTLLFRCIEIALTNIAMNIYFWSVSLSYFMKPLVLTCVLKPGFEIQASETPGNVTLTVYIDIVIRYKKILS